MTAPIFLGVSQVIASPHKATQDPIGLHVLQRLPDPYPQYPILITRTINFLEAYRIKKLYRLADLPPAGIDSKGLPLTYEKLAFKVYKQGGNSLTSEEEAFVHFVNSIYFFCYEKHHYGEMFSLTYKMRRARGSVVCNPYKKVTPITALDDSLIDEILEMALQNRDFQAIRAILNFEGYGIAIKEPNDLVIPAAWVAKKSDKEEGIEIEVTTEEYEMWQEIQKAPPEEITEPSPFVETSEYKAFVERMAQNIPLHLEHAIRNRDIPTLRAWLRFYGKLNIASPQTHSAISEIDRTKNSTGAQPSLDI